MNLEKRQDVKFVSAKNVGKCLKNSKFVRCCPVAPDSDIYEIIQRRSITNDKIPVQEGSLSKIL